MDRDISTPKARLRAALQVVKDNVCASQLAGDGYMHANEVINALQAALTAISSLKITFSQEESEDLLKLCCSIWVSSGLDFSSVQLLLALYTAYNHTAHVNMFPCRTYVWKLTTGA
jgi:hypothetical protein